MKKILAYVAFMIFALSVNAQDKRGDLDHASGKGFKTPVPPPGMVLINGGSFTMGSVEDDDVSSTLIAPPKVRTVTSFYMDETEISNYQYRLFVHWVRDSIVRDKLAMRAYEEGLTEDDEGVGNYRFKDVDTAASPYYQYLLDKNADAISNSERPEGRTLDWDKEIIWNVNEYPTVEYAEILDSMYLPVEERFYGERIIDTRKLKYSYVWVDMQNAVKKGGNRKDYIKKEELQIYPDTTVWVRDFSYSYNEPMMRNYFWHIAYNNYPVVGVTFDQAKAFCDWRTKRKNEAMRKDGRPPVSGFRLPTEAEWEYAARGGMEHAIYPWGGPYVHDEVGGYLANFKPMRGDYMADGALYTWRVYDPPTKKKNMNGYGLYNMAGNVSEWTNSAFDESSYEFVSTMNPNYENANNKKKVIKGGSWKDVALYLRVSTRDYEYKDSARSYIGFRTVQDYQGALELDN